MPSKILREDQDYIWSKGRPKVGINTVSFSGLFEVSNYGLGDLFVNRKCLNWSSKEKVRHRHHFSSLLKWSYLVWCCCDEANPLATSPCRVDDFKISRGKTTELAHCQYFAHGRDSRQAKKGCKNFWGHECRKRGIELFGVKSFSKMWCASGTSPTSIVHLSWASLNFY